MKNSVWSKRLIHFSRFPMWVIGAVLLTSCVSIAGDSAIMIRSNPHGVPFDIVTERGHIVSSGKTPLIVSLDRSTGYRVKFKTKDGTRTLATLPICTSPSLWYLLTSGWFADAAICTLWWSEDRVEVSLGDGE